MLILALLEQTSKLTLQMLLQHKQFSLSIVATSLLKESFCMDPTNVQFNVPLPGDTQKRNWLIVTMDDEKIGCSA